VNRGFFIEPAVIWADECTALLAAIAPTTRAGARHLLSNPAVRECACDARLTTIAARALGSTAVPFRATLFEKSGEKNWLIAWHQDTALPLAERTSASGWGPWSAKAGVLYAHAPAWALERVVALRLHLDASTSENGPLRVIPGSHTRGVLPDADVWRIAASEVQVECPVPMGGVLAMRPLIIHASSKARTAAPRRVLHIEYADSLDLAPGIRVREC
jgi:hypothetical protein